MTKAKKAGKNHTCPHENTYLDRTPVPNTNKVICRIICADCYKVLDEWNEYK